MSLTLHQMSKERLFTKYFPLPFTADRFGEWCVSINQQLCFQFRPDPEIEPAKIKRYVDVINGLSNTVFKHEYNYDSSIGYVIEDGVPLISIRGWGHLTGVGGLNLPDDQAAAIQDDLGNYIVERLSYKINER